MTDLEQYEAILPNGDRASAPDLDSALFTASTLLDEAYDLFYGQRRRAQQDVIITRSGIYDNVGTVLARSGAKRAQGWSE